MEPHVPTPCRPSTGAVVLANMVVCFALMSSIPAAAVVINFDDLATGVPVTTQYPEVTFSSDPGFENRTAADFDLGTSLPNYICTAEIGGMLTCTNLTRLDFTSPVSNLTLYAAGDDMTGAAAQIDVYVNNVLSGTVNVITDAVFETPHLVDLTAFSSVTRIDIDDIKDPGGLAWDDFQFETLATPVTPTTWGGIKAAFR